MKNNFKNFFKFNNWKRWVILFFTLGFSFLFIGLSFGLKSNEIKPSSDYANNITLNINPKDSTGKPLSNESIANQFLYNIKNRIEDKYPESVVTTKMSDDFSFEINVTKIKNGDDTKEFLKFLTQKESLTILPINIDANNNNYYQSTINNNYVFKDATFNNNRISLTMKSNETNSIYDWLNNLNNSLPENKQSTRVIIWKNYETLREIVEKEKYPGTVYEYLFVNGSNGNGFTPEDKEDENSATVNPLFKDEITGLDGKTKYKPTDFIVSKNDITDFKNPTLELLTSFGVSNFESTPKYVETLYNNIYYWIAGYDISNYIVENQVSQRGMHAYTFLIVAMVSIYTLVSIYVVINYGYLGIFSIIILSVIIFLALLMMMVFFGDYDAVLITSFISSTLIILEFIISFFDKIKASFLKGNSISKSVKNTIKNSKNSLILKSILLIIISTTFYMMTSLLGGSFSVIILICCLAIPIIVIPLMFIFSWIFLSFKKFEKDPRTIGFWKREYREGNSQMDKLVSSLDDSVDVTVSNESARIEPQYITTYNENNLFILNKFKKFSKSKGTLVCWSIFSYLLLFGLIFFLVSFFTNGKILSNSFNITPIDKNQIVMKIAQSSDTNSNSLNEEQVTKIKEILLQNEVDENSVIEKDGIIVVELVNSFSIEKINQISNQIYNIYNVVIVTSEFESSNTYNLMIFTLYAALIALVAMCVFVLLWMDWTKAILLLIMGIMIIGSFIAIILFGFVQINALLSLIGLLAFIIFTFSSINVLINVNEKIKKARIIELTKENIEEIVYNQTYKSIKSLISIKSIILLSSLILSVFNVIPITSLLFLMGFVIINLILTMFLLPKVLIRLEHSRAKLARKVVLENYWDTEKVKEQSFKDINNIK